MHVYDLRITDEQASLIVNALDVYSRILMGQLETVTETIKWENFNKRKFNIDKLHELDAIIRNAKTLLGHPPNGSAGIHSHEIPDKARKAYDMQQVIRYISSWAREGKDPSRDQRDYSQMMGVNFDPPSKSSFDEKYELPTMKVITQRLQNLEALTTDP